MFKEGFCDRSQTTDIKQTVFLVKTPTSMLPGTDRLFDSLEHKSFVGVEPKTRTLCTSKLRDNVAATILTTFWRRQSLSSALPFSVWPLSAMQSTTCITCPNSLTA